MRTLTEKYNGVLEGRYAKAQFLRDARLAQPQFITQFNGYDDAVTILKNRGMISEAKSKFVQLTVTDANGATVAKYFYPVEWIHSQKNSGELDHYLNAWVKNMTPMEDKLTYVIRMSQGVQQPDEDAVEMTAKDLEDAKKIKAIVTQRARDLVALHKKLGSHEKAAAQLGLDPHKYNRGIQVNESIDTDNEDEVDELVKHWKSQMREGMSDDEFQQAQQTQRLEDHPEKDMIKKIQALIAKEKNLTKLAHGTFAKSISETLLKEDKFSNLAKELGGKINPETLKKVLFGKIKLSPIAKKEFDSFMKDLKGMLGESKGPFLVPYWKVKTAELEKQYALLNNSKTPKEKEVQKHIGAELKKRGITVNENVYKDVAEKIDTILPDSVRRGLDYELEKAGFDTVNINFDEPTRMKYLKKAVDRLSKDPNYYLNQLSGDSSRTKKHDREVEVDQKALFKGTVDPKGGKAEGNTDTFNAMKKAQLREAVKSLVVSTLNEGTEKLERHLVDSDNTELTNMFPDYTKGVKDLMNVVLDIEKAFVSHRDKVEGAFKMVGNFRAPGVAKSFVAELVDVLRKYQNIPLPKTPVAAEEVPMEEEDKQLA